MPPRAASPARRTRFGCGTRWPDHRMSSNLSGGFLKPSRIAGVAPSSPTKTELSTARKITASLRFARAARAGPCPDQGGPVIAKTVCGFLNGEGGTLLIGVDDHGAVLGLDADMTTLRHRTGRDRYELFLRQCLDNGLSSPTAATVGIAFHEVEGRDVCVVSVARIGNAADRPRTRTRRHPTRCGTRSRHGRIESHPIQRDRLLNLHRPHRATGQRRASDATTGDRLGPNITTLPPRAYGANGSRRHAARHTVAAARHRG